MVQQTINSCQDMQLVLSVLRWLEMNLKEVILSKPAVHLALVVLERLAAESYNKAWAIRLDRFVLHFINSEVRNITILDLCFQKHIQDLMVTAALHPAGYLLAKEVVSKNEVVSEATRKELLQCLARSVDIIRSSKTGMFVLKALE